MLVVTHARDVREFAWASRYLGALTWLSPIICRFPFSYFSRDFY